MPDCDKLNIAVTPAGYDNIGAVLASMGEGFAYNNITSDDLCNPRVLSRYSVVFINCSSECHDYAHEARENLRHFVRRGGSLYVSDWAGAYISEAFPEFVTFSDVGGIGGLAISAGISALIDQLDLPDMTLPGGMGIEGSVVATVTDPGLHEIIGPKLELHFDMPSWKAIGHARGDTRVYLRGSCDLEYGGYEENKPLLVSFDYGQGHVIYTAFHNEPQLSEKERQLLRFLVLKPVTAEVTRATIRLLVTERLSAEKETVASIDPGGASPIYSHVVPPGVNLKILLNWRGRQTALQLSVYSPDGRLHQQLESNKPPLGVTVPNAQAGTWQYQVTGRTVPYTNFPYVLTVATQPAAALMAPAGSQPGLCPRCGHTNRPGANFCAGCGQRL